MGAAFLITLREGLEVALILSIILAYLNAIGRRDRHGAVWAGAGAAAAVSAVAGGVIFAIAGGLSHTAAETFEGVAGLLAVAVLTWMIFWMRRNAINIKGELQGKVEGALASGSGLALASVAFLVVLREGLETALFLFSAFSANSETSAILTIGGAVLGLGLAALLGVLIYRGGRRLNLRLFFRVTGALVLVVAASLLVYSIHELYEVGAFDALRSSGLLEGAPVFSGILNVILQPIVGLGGGRTWLEVIAFFGYLLVVGPLFFRSPRSPVAPASVEGRQDDREEATQAKR
jgi:high-affinity iron transporter